MVPIVKEENLGEDMAIDEKKIGSNMYTVLSNRQTGKIALLASTLKTSILAEIMRAFSTKAFEVRTVTMDLSPSYDWLIRQVFMNTTHIADKFHVHTHLFDALQSMRIYHRQQELTKRRLRYEEFKNKKTLRRQQCKKSNTDYKPERFSYKESTLPNGETKRELLARSMYLLYKLPHKWTPSQSQRAEILFMLYPDIKTAYELCCEFRIWYGRNNIGQNIQYIRSSLHKWYKDVVNSDIEEMLNFKSLVERNEPYILNYFISGKTNANAEVLNAKIQNFIHSNMGARDINFFLFRLRNYFS